MAYSNVLHLEDGMVLTVTADSLSSGTVQRLAQPGDSTTAYSLQSVAVSSSLLLGPYTSHRQYSIVTLNGRLSYATAAPDNSTSQSVVTNVAADGAITIAAGIVSITKSSAACLLTLAAPTAEQEGTIIPITSRTAKAHTITATALIQDGVTGGAKTTATFDAFAGASITLAAINLNWHVLALNAVTVS